MKIVIVHYHLRPGGVTGVIEQQVLALHNELPEAEIVVLSGEARDSFSTLPCSVVVVPELNYFVPNDQNEAEKCELIILKSLLKEITDVEMIFHFHNPTLGKNPSLTGAINSLADKSVPIVSFCHDFSEDRPLNHSINKKYAEWCESDVHNFLYPDKSNIHYLTLNYPDSQRKHWELLEKSTIQQMAPPVQKISAPQNSRGEIASWLKLDLHKEWVFYPVRGIERKNIGEFILLALLDNEKREWILARKPANPNEIDLYEQWVQLAEDLEIPVKFNAMERVPFADMMHAADRIITTSMREGFGMAYIEPWFIGKPVAGRELPMVVNDMRRAGVWQDLLYAELPVPIGEEWVDFGSLDQQKKMKLLRVIAKSEKVQRVIKEHGDWWKTLTQTPSSDIFQQNFETIQKQYSCSAFGKRLKELYLSLIQ